jgi:hypothetical protein
MQKMTNSARKRRWYQISLRNFFFVCVIAGLVCSWYGARYLEQRLAIESSEPILGPTTAGGSTTALVPPSDDEVLRALEKQRPLESEFAYRVNVRIIKEKVAESVDPARAYPLLGPARVHHAYYKCTVHFREQTYYDGLSRRATDGNDFQEVIYIDHNHFHLADNIDTGPATKY